MTWSAPGLADRVAGGRLLGNERVTETPFSEGDGKRQDNEQRPSNQGPRVGAQERRRIRQMEEDVRTDANHQRINDVASRPGRKARRRIAIPGYTRPPPVAPANPVAVAKDTERGVTMGARMRHGVLALTGG